MRRRSRLLRLSATISLIAIGSMVGVALVTRVPARGRRASRPACQRRVSPAWRRSRRRLARPVPPSRLADASVDRPSRRRSRYASARPPIARSYLRSGPASGGSSSKPRVRIDRREPLGAVHERSDRPVWARDAVLRDDAPVRAELCRPRRGVDARRHDRWRLPPRRCEPLQPVDQGRPVLARLRPGRPGGLLHGVQRPRWRRRTRSGRHVCPQAQPGDQLHERGRGPWAMPSDPAAAGVRPGRGAVRVDRAEVTNDMHDGTIGQGDAFLGARAADPRERGVPDGRRPVRDIRRGEHDAGSLGDRGPRWRRSS